MVGTMRRASYTGADDIRSAFNSLYKGDVCFSVWPNDRVPLFQYTGDDHDMGIAFFEEHIMALEQAGNDELLFLRFHPMLKKGTWVDKKTTTISETPFRVTELEIGKVSGSAEPYSTGNAQVNFKMFEAIQVIKDLPEKMADRQSAFEQKVMLLLEEGEDDHAPEPVQVDPVEKYMNMAIGALKEPNVMNNVIGLIKMFVPNYNPPFMRNTQPAINGVADTETDQPIHQVNIDKLDAALVRLQKHCCLDDDLTRLADIAENDPKQFKMLLNLLRSM